MLMLAILLQSVDGAPALRPLLGPAIADCVDERGCHVDGGRRFRLESRPTVSQHPMERAMEGFWQPCETTGAPVCPSKGTLIFRAEIETN
jgi:hypothetical protein